MRNIICISLAAAGLAEASVAEEGPRTGCYTRTYTEAHLAARPSQVVSIIRMKVYDATGGRFANMDVLFANQGHSGRAGFGGQWLSQFLLCFNGSNGNPGCAVECDGGSFTVTRQNENGMTFATDYLMVGDVEGCGGAVDLAEVPGQTVKYKLNRVSAGECSGL